MDSDIAGIVVLKRGPERRLRSGHQWVYSGDVGSLEGEPGKGSVVEVVDARGRFVGMGHYNAESMLRVRLLSRRRELLDRAWLAQRLAQAWAHRQRCLDETAVCRVVYGEGDSLPGLVVDRYGPVVVLQTLTAGMEAWQPVVVELLQELLDPGAVVERNDVHSRRLEGLETRWGLLAGTLPEGLEVEYAGLAFAIDPLSGQKTGIFLDQRENQRAAARWSGGRSVLDAFCHGGGFGLRAAQAGATAVTGVDSSADALHLARANAERNGLSQRCTWVEANVFDFLREGEESWEVIVLDPPAFAHSRKALPGALRGYKEINLRAMKRLAPGGVLVTCSCSYHMTRDLFLEMLADAAADARRTVRVVEERGQPADHPRALGHPETHYLKCFTLTVE